MEKLTKHRNILLKELQVWNNYTSSIQPKLKYQLFIDKEEVNFLVLCIGWHNNEYRHHTVFHIELKEDKVALYALNVGFDLLGNLIKAGIEEDDIIDMMDEIINESIDLIAA